MATHTPSNGKTGAGGERGVYCKDHLDVQHKVCGRVGNEGDQGRKNGSVSTWKESVTKKVVFGFMGNEPSPAGLCALVRPFCQFPYLNNGDNDTYVIK